jgi:hypothetical protein
MPRRTVTRMRSRDIQSIPPLAEEILTCQEGELNAELLEANQHVLQEPYRAQNGR